MINQLSQAPAKAAACPCAVKSYQSEGDMKMEGRKYGGGGEEVMEKGVGEGEGER
jgi:hypothetical protein